MEIFKNIRLGFFDFIKAIKMIRFWSYFGLHDVKMRYQRSILGPFWITLSTLIMITALSFLYSGLLGEDMADYVPYIGLGLIFWYFISITINESCLCFIDYDELMKQISIPIFVYIFRVITRNFIVLFHNLILLIPLYIFSNLSFSLLSILFFIVNLFLVGLVFSFLGITLGILSSRYRDIPPTITNVTQVLFFLTPVLWMPSSVDGRKIAIFILDLNPFNHVLKSIRDPFLFDQFFNLEIIVLILILSVIAFYLVGKYSKRIVMWI